MLPLRGLVETIVASVVFVLKDGRDVADGRCADFVPILTLSIYFEF